MNTPETIVKQFPIRPLEVSKVIVIKPIVTVIIGFIICLLAFLIPYLGVPGLLNDYEISKNPIEVNATIKGKCESKLILTNCDVTLTYKGNRVVRHFYFFDWQNGDYYVTALAAKNNSTLLTVDLAIDKMSNRIIMQLVFFLLIIGGGISLMITARRGQQMNQILAQMNGRRLHPVLVPVTLKSVKGVMVAHYTWSINQTTKKYFATFKEKKEGGILPVPTDEVAQIYALGVMPVDEKNVPILLDKNLTRINLTEQERTQLLNSLVTLS